MYIVITGSSRGIGLALTELALAKGYHVLSVVRDGSSLSKMKEKFSKLEILTLDITDQDAHDKIFNAVNHWPRLDVIINNAGVYLGDSTLHDFEYSFLVNSIKPFFITRTLLPLLKKSVRPVSLQISSLMGSIDDSSGGHASYRASKTALNMLFKGLALDEKWLISLLIHPGWVKTRMGGDNAPTSAIDSAAGIMEILDKAQLSDSGKFLTFEGRKLPW